MNFYSSTEAKNRQAKSGNPGYLDGFPVLIAQPDASNTGAMQTFDGGFKLAGADEQGSCKNKLASATEDQESALNEDPTVMFRQDLSYQCSLEMDLTEL